MIRMSYSDCNISVTFPSKISYEKQLQLILVKKKYPFTKTFIYLFFVS
jgi:hypothetical protein